MKYNSPTLQRIPLQLEQALKTLNNSTIYLNKLKKEKEKESVQAFKEYMEVKKGIKKLRETPGLLIFESGLQKEKNRRFNIWINIKKELEVIIEKRKEIILKNVSLMGEVKKKRLINRQHGADTARGGRDVLEGMKWED